MRTGAADHIRTPGPLNRRVRRRAGTPVRRADDEGGPGIDIGPRLEQCLVGDVRRRIQDVQYTISDDPRPLAGVLRERRGRDSWTCRTRRQA